MARAPPAETQGRHRRTPSAAPRTWLDISCPEHGSLPTENRIVVECVSVACDSQLAPRQLLANAAPKPAFLLCSPCTVYHPISPSRTYCRRTDRTPQKCVQQHANFGNTARSSTSVATMIWFLFCFTCFTCVHSASFRGVDDVTVRAERDIDAAAIVLSEIAQSEVLLTFDARSDRLGSFLQVGIAAWALSAAHGWRFCAPGSERGRNALYLMHTGWPACSESPTMRSRGEKRLFSECVRWTSDGVMRLAPGTYRLPDRSDAGGWQAIGRAERAAPGSVWGAARSRDLRAQLLAANQALAVPRWDASSEARERDDAERVVTVAMHVRRGDVVDNAYWRDRNYYVSDAAFIGVVRALRARYRCKIEVHIFSEDYTTVDCATMLDAPECEGRRGYQRRAIDWSGFNVLASAEQPRGGIPTLHLASFGRTDVASVDKQFRDWCFFIDADVLVISSTFSAVPALARPPEAGLTLIAGDAEGHPGYFDGDHWTPPWWRFVGVGHEGERALIDPVEGDFRYVAAHL